MPNIGPLHPQVVHFVVALGLVGVLFRLISLFWGGKSTWLNPAAAVLIIFAAGASVVAAKSGTDAHGVAERIPGAREAVQDHERWGERTRNIWLGLAGLEIIGLLAASTKAGRPIRFLTAAAGVFSAAVLYHTSDLGGDLVYGHAGGIGTRSGDPADVKNLLVAGLYHESRAARDSGRSEEAARLIEELRRVRPADTTVLLLAAESALRDRKDPSGALAQLDSLRLPDSSRLEVRYGLLRAQALSAAGQPDSAKAQLQRLAQRYPQNQAVKTALEKMQSWER